MARLAGFEPTTLWFVARYSIQLSYSRIQIVFCVSVGAAGRIRTHDPLVRSQILYPTELQPREEETIGVRQGKSKGGFLKIPHMRYEPGVKWT